MDDPMYLDDAYLWLNDYTLDERKFLALSAAGLVIIAAAALGVAVWLLGPLISLGGLVIVGFMWLAIGRIGEAEQPAIRADTVRPRLNHVPRMQNPVTYGPEYMETYIRIILACLTAPIQLPAEAWKMMKRRRRMLHDIDWDPAAKILALIVERDGAWTFDELCDRLGEETATLGLGALVDVEPVIWLQEPDRVALTDKAKDAIRAV